MKPLSLHRCWLPTLCLAGSFLLPSLASAQIVISSLEGYYSDQVSASPGYAAFDGSTLSPAAYTGTSDPNGQTVNGTRDNTFTFQFTDSITLDSLLIGVYDSVSAGSGTLKIFEVGDVNGDISGDLGGTPIFAETFSTTATTFTTQAGTKDVGTLDFDLAAAPTLVDRTSVSATAGYAIQLDLSGGNVFNVSNRTGTDPGEWQSYYRETFTAPNATNNFMLGFVAVPEPSSAFLLLSAGALFLTRRSIRRS